MNNLKFPLMETRFPLKQASQVVASFNHIMPRGPYLRSINPQQPPPRG